MARIDLTHDFGVGSVRRLRVPPFASFEETVTAAVPDALIEYRITRGGFPVKDHSARTSFSPHGSGTRLRYEIALGSQVPALAPLIATTLRRNLRKGLADVDARA